MAEQDITAATIINYPKFKAPAVIGGGFDRGMDCRI